MLVEYTYYIYIYIPHVTGAVGYFRHPLAAAAYLFSQLLDWRFRTSEVLESFQLVLFTPCPSFRLEVQVRDFERRTFFCLCKSCDRCLNFFSILFVAWRLSFGNLFLLWCRFFFLSSFLYEAVRRQRIVRVRAWRSKSLKGSLRELVVAQNQTGTVFQFRCKGGTVERTLFYCGRILQLALSLALFLSCTCCSYYQDVT